MLTKANIKFLKSLGAKLELTYQVGKKGLTDTAIEMFENAIKCHELIKVSVLKNVEGDIDQIANELATKLNAELVNTIGRTFLLYRKNPQNVKIRL